MKVVILVNIVRFFTGQQRCAEHNVENGLDIVRSHQKLGCLSQGVELSEQAVGPTNVRRSILKEERPEISKGTSRAEMHEECKTIRQTSGTIGTISGSDQERG